MVYEPTRVAIACAQRDILKSLIDRKYVPVRIDLKDTLSMDTLLLTRGQIASIEKARALGRRKYKTIRMSRKQIEKNREYQGGYLSLPDYNEDNSTKNKTGFSDAYDDGFYLIKRGYCIKIHPVQDNGLYLETTEPFSSYDGYADGLYLKDGQVMKNGEEILMTENGPFENYPILKWLL